MEATVEPQVDPDELLMLRYVQGDVRSFETLVSRYRGPLTGFLYKHVGDRQAAEDLFQETFIRVIRAAERYDPRGRFRTWLYTIARNLTVDHHRRMSLRRTASLEAPVGSDGTRLGSLLPEDETENPPPEHDAARDEFARAVRHALAGLSPEQREVFLLREESHLSFKDIARVVDCPENTAKSRMRYALEHLRQALGGEARWREALARERSPGDSARSDKT